MTSYNAAVFWIGRNAVILTVDIDGILKRLTVPRDKIKMPIYEGKSIVVDVDSENKELHYREIVPLKLDPEEEEALKKFVDSFQELKQIRVVKDYESE